MACLVFPVGLEAEEVVGEAVLALETLLDKNVNDTIEFHLIQFHLIHNNQN
jgi:hypothetical protein